jgi:hypothetical protein
VALTSMDGLTAAIIPFPQFWFKVGATTTAFIPFTPWGYGGIPGGGAAPTGGLNGATITGPVAGQIPTPAAVTGATSAVVRASATQTAGIAGVWFIDRQWGNVPVVTTTTAQAVTSPTWVPRDQSASTNGVGVFLALECSATTGNVGAITNTTVSYTNSAGTAGRTATLASFPATAPTGTWAPFALQAGDVGVRSVQSITLGTSYVSGQVNLIAFRYLFDIATLTAGVPTPSNFTQLGLPRIWDGTVMQILYMPTGSGTNPAYGSITFAQG